MARSPSALCRLALGLRSTAAKQRCCGPQVAEPAWTDRAPCNSVDLLQQAWQTQASTGSYGTLSFPPPGLPTAADGRPTKFHGRAGHAPVCPSTPPALLPDCRQYSTVSTDPEEAPSSEAGEEPKEDDEEVDVKTLLMDAALSHVAKCGWTDEALHAAADEMGLSRATAGLLDRGPVELVEYHVRCKNNAFYAKFKETEAEREGMGVTQKIFLALKMRLEMNIPLIDSRAQALALMSHPANSPAALTLLSELIDEIWHLVGDKSVDTSWYTKRALLAGVYAATDLYMLTDTSPGYQDTWEALERRLTDVKNAGGVVRQTQDWLEKLLGSAGVPPPPWEAAVGKRTKSE